MTTSDPATAKFHLDKRIPVVIVLTLILQFAGMLLVGAYTAAKLEARIATLETFMIDNKETRERLAVIELQLKVISNTLMRMEDKLVKGQ